MERQVDIDLDALDRVCETYTQHLEEHIREGRNIMHIEDAALLAMFVADWPQISQILRTAQREVTVLQYMLKSLKIPPEYE